MHAEAQEQSLGHLHHDSMRNVPTNPTHVTTTTGSVKNSGRDTSHNGDFQSLSVSVAGLYPILFSNFLKHYTVLN